MSHEVGSPATGDPPARLLEPGEHRPDAVTHELAGGGTVACSTAAVESALSVDPEDVEPATELTFARNVFVPLTTACRYTCTYCTYYDPPGEATLLSPDEVREIVQRGAAAGCTEALFTFGDDPDERYTAIHDQLDSWGYDSIHGYLRAVCALALEEGLLPHANPGDQTEAELATVAPVNPSMGVMLETTADVRAHGGPRAKSPADRRRTGCPVHDGHPGRHRRDATGPGREPARDSGATRALRPHPGGHRPAGQAERALAGRHP